MSDPIKVKIVIKEGNTLKHQITTKMHNQPLIDSVKKAFKAPVLNYTGGPIFIKRFQGDERLASAKALSGARFSRITRNTDDHDEKTNLVTEPIKKQD